MVGIGILIPVIPQLFANPDSPYYLLSTSTSVRSGYVLLGLLTASYPVALFFAAPILGQLSDRFGRKPILTLSLLGTAFGYFLFALGIVFKSIPLLFIARIFDGLTGGNISVAQAAIADVTDPKNRAKNFGMIGAAFGLGFILGPFLGGKLADQTLVSWFSAQTPFYVAGILALLNAVVLMRFFKETHTTTTAVAVDIFQSIKRIGSAKRYGEVRALFLVMFLMSAGFAFFTSFFNVFLVHRFGFTEGKIGTFFGFVGICVVITQALVTRLVAKRFRDIQTLSITYFVTAVMLVAYVVVPSAQYFIFVTPLFAIANGLTQANSMALLSRKAGGEGQGELLGVNAGFTSLGQAIPPLLAGTIAAVLSPSIPILLGAALITTAGIVFLLHKPHLTHTKTS